MPTRRETIILAPLAGKGDEAQKVLSDFLREMDGYDGYLGGSVTRNSSEKELIADAFVLTFDFESTDKVRAFRKEIGEKINPISQDDKSTKSTEQGGVLWDPDFDRDAPGLEFDKGNGLFAQLMHVHAHLVDEYTVSTA